MDISLSKPATTKYTPVPISSTHPPRDSIDDLSIDLENDSDTTLLSSSSSYSTSPNKKTPPSSRSRKWKWNKHSPDALTWIRFTILVSLQLIIILLFSSSSLFSHAHPHTAGEEWSTSDTETGGDVNGLYKPTRHAYTLLTPDAEKFIPNMSSNDDRMAVRRNWDMLMPLGSGTVSVPEYAQHPLLGQPIDDDPIHSGAIFEASWTHALHCA
ncbi:hypothetical protein LOCC1_G007037, partial [Lachnellula occidentalis]